MGVTFVLNLDRIREYMDDLRCCLFGVDDHLKQLSECSKDKLPDFGHLFTHARSCNIFSKVVRRSITKSHQKSQVLYISIISTYHLRKLDEGNCRNPFSFTQHWSGLAARLALVDRTASTPPKNRVLSDVLRAIIKPRSSFWMTENGEAKIR